MSWLWEFFVSPSHPTITRGDESKALSDLSRDFDTGGTPATNKQLTRREKWRIIGGNEFVWKGFF